MAGMEKPEGGDMVAERTTSLAVRHGESVFWTRIHDLRLHVSAGRLSPEVLSQIAAEEETVAIEKFRTEREAGLHNDTRSITKGLTALVRQYVKAHYESRFPEPQASLMSPCFDEVAESDEGVRFYNMRIPDGVFVCDNEGPTIHFYTAASHVGLSGIIPSHEAKNRIPASQYDVIRIEGDAGELWQNPRYNSDSTLRPPENP